MKPKFEYILEKQGDTKIVFKVLEQNHFINDVYGDEIKKSFNGFDICSCNFPEISFEKIFLRGTEKEYNFKKSTKYFTTKEERDKIFKQYSKALEMFKEWYIEEFKKENKQKEEITLEDIMKRLDKIEKQIEEIRCKK